MLASTVHHELLRSGEMSAVDLAHRAGLSLQDTYAELIRLEALDAVSMRGYRKRFWSAVLPQKSTRREARLLRVTPHEPPLEA
jgi:hypothetical protein